MNFLTKRSALRAWTASFVQRQSGGRLSLGDLREAYERDVRLDCLFRNEQAAIRTGLKSACEELLGAATEISGTDINDDTLLEGVAFRPRETMMGKPVLWVESETIINLNSAFNAKGGLSSAGVANTGVACAISCGYCSSPAVMNRNPLTEILRVLGLDHGDVVIRKLDPIETARRQLTNPDGTPRYKKSGDNRILEMASIVDPLSTQALMEETDALVRLVFELTGWRVRILTKSRLLAAFARRYEGDLKERLLLGFSYGIPEDNVARVVEAGAALPSIRRQIHNELMNEGFAMFGMACPVLPVADFRALAARIAKDLKADRLDKIWVEAINQRGNALLQTINRLQGPHPDLANRVARVRGSKILWEVEYNRAAFLAFSEILPPDKLAFLTYVTPESETWWSERTERGAVLL